MRTKQVFNYLSKCNRKIKELTKVNGGGCPKTRWNSKQAN